MRGDLENKENAAILKRHGGVSARRLFGGDAVGAFVVVAFEFLPRQLLHARAPVQISTVTRPKVAGKWNRSKVKIPLSQPSGKAARRVRVRYTTFKLKPQAQMETSDKSCHGLQRVATTLAVAVISSFLGNTAAARTTVTLPIEVVGENGTMSSTTVEVPTGRAGDVRSLWMQIHNLAYADMVSVQINSSAWLPLNNNTVAVAEPQMTVLCSLLRIA
jgi:hypothetical protein